MSQELRAVSGSRGILRPNVLGATLESFPLFRCPGCGQTGHIDADQFRGSVSVQCECGWHQTIDWASASPTVTG